MCVVHGVILHLLELEHLQKRALRMAYPDFNYQEAMSSANIQTLYQRREAKCRELFAAMKRPTQKLPPLLPEQNK